MIAPTAKPNVTRVASDISNPGTNVANYEFGAADWNGQNGSVTTVGSAGPLSASFYGTFDQGDLSCNVNGNLAASSRYGVNFAVERRNCACSDGELTHAAH